MPHMLPRGYDTFPAEAQTLARLRQNLLADLAARSATALAAEWDLLRLLLWAHEQLPGGSVALPHAGDPGFNAALPRTAQSETRTQATGARAVRRSRVLAWDQLVRLYGSAPRID